MQPRRSRAAPPKGAGAAGGEEGGGGGRASSKDAAKPLLGMEELLAWAAGAVNLRVDRVQQLVRQAPLSKPSSTTAASRAALTGVGPVDDSRAPLLCTHWRMNVCSLVHFWCLVFMRYVSCPQVRRARAPASHDTLVPGLHITLRCEALEALRIQQQRRQLQLAMHRRSVCPCRRAAGDLRQQLRQGRVIVMREPVVLDCRCRRPYNVTGVS